MYTLNRPASINQISQSTQSQEKATTPQSIYHKSLNASGMKSKNSLPTELGSGNIGNIILKQSSLNRPPLLFNIDCSVAETQQFTSQYLIEANSIEKTLSSADVSMPHRNSSNGLIDKSANSKGLYARSANHTPVASLGFLNQNNQIEKLKNDLADVKRKQSKSKGRAQSQSKTRDFSSLQNSQFPNGTSNGNEKQKHPKAFDPTDIQFDSISSEIKGAKTKNIVRAESNQHLINQVLYNNQKSFNVKVFARFRPFNKMEIELSKNGLGNDCCIFPDQHTVVLMPESQVFTLDRIFAIESPQIDIYDSVGKDTIVDVLNGYNGTIFAYGQTGSGKTFSIFGNMHSPEDKGLIPRSISHIFDYICKNEEDVQYVLTCSMLEIYKENLYDLLTTQKPDLKIKESPNRGIYVQGLTQISVSSEEELFQILQLGDQARKVASTRINQYSSRSHTIFMLEIKQRYSNDSEQKGKLNLVDLAGSEKVGKTGAIGDILEEAKKINLSLSCLGNVIHALTTNTDHIPYRDSKLTRILQESLGGNFKTSLLVTCSTHSYSVQETISTLKFATRAQSIKNHFQMNIQNSPEALQRIIMALQKDLLEARLELETLRKYGITEYQVPTEDKILLLPSPLQIMTKSSFKKREKVTPVKDSSNSSSCMSSNGHIDSISSTPMLDEKVPTRLINLDALMEFQNGRQVQKSQSSKNLTTEEQQQMATAMMLGFSPKLNRLNQDYQNLTKIEFLTERLEEKQKEIASLNGIIHQQKNHITSLNQDIIMLKNSSLQYENNINQLLQQREHMNMKQNQTHSSTQVYKLENDQLHRQMDAIKEALIASERKIQQFLKEKLENINSNLNEEVSKISRFRTQNDLLRSYHTGSVHDSSRLWMEMFPDQSQLQVDETVQPFLLSLQNICVNDKIQQERFALLIRSFEQAYQNINGNKENQQMDVKQTLHLFKYELVKFATINQTFQCHIRALETTESICFLQRTFQEDEHQLRIKEITESESLLEKAREAHSHLKARIDIIEADQIQTIDKIQNTAVGGIGSGIDHKNSKIVQPFHKSQMVKDDLFRNRKISAFIDGLKSLVIKDKSEVQDVLDHNLKHLVLDFVNLYEQDPREENQLADINEDILQSEIKRLQNQTLITNAERQIESFQINQLKDTLALNKQQINQLINTNRELVYSLKQSSKDDTEYLNKIIKELQLQINFEFGNNQAPENSPAVSHKNSVVSVPSRKESLTIAPLGVNSKTLTINNNTGFRYDYSYLQGGESKNKPVYNYK